MRGCERRDIIEANRRKEIDHASTQAILISEELFRCMVNAFEYFGGVPETVLTDNMKTVILGREAGKPIWNSLFEDFAKDMGFIPKVCRPRSPRTKGKVERLVHYVKDNFLPGRAFVDLDDLSRQALEWCKKVDSKCHGTTGEITLNELRKEPLQPLPAPEICKKYRWEPRRVTADGFVSFDGVKYSVPWQYSGRDVLVRLIHNNIEIYLGETRIACHKLEQTSGKIIWLKGQYSGLAEKNGIAMPISFVRQISPSDVEQRPYDEALGVASNTHLSVALAIEALWNRLTVFYTTLPNLIGDLQKAQLQDKLEKRWKIYLRPHVLVVDEVGYMQLNRSQAELFFWLISKRYETGSVILKATSTSVAGVN